MAKSLLSPFHRSLKPPEPVNTQSTGINAIPCWLYRNIYTKILPDFVRELNAATNGCETILDVGCGARSPIEHFSKKFHRSVGVDMHKPSIEISRSAGIHSEYKQIDILHIEKRFKLHSFDCVIVLDVIEHLKKKEGFKLLRQMEKLARKRIIIFTPTGFLPQGEYDENPWQVHKSGWEVEEMQRLGYRVIGINGWKPLRGEYAEIKFWPKYFWISISDITQRLVRYFPRHAFQLL